MDAALGISIHTGWAVAVAVGGSPAAPVVLARDRVQLIDPALPRQVFHAAADGPPVDAERLVLRVERSAREHAERTLGAVQDVLAADGHGLAAVGLAAEPRDVPSELPRILANHALIHAAEGELYRAALEEAAEWIGLPVVQVASKRIAGEVADRLGLGSDRQAAIVGALGKQLGPPWQADHKQATLVALLALTEAAVGGPATTGRPASGATRRGR